IGGGTSDFSLFQSGNDGVQILANHGVRIGGTDFDRAISIDRVMPSLGRGGLLRKQFGAGDTPVPPALYNDLATWEKIPFLYTPQNVRMAKEMAQLAHDRVQLDRLVRVLENELGHELAFAAERGKIAANTGGGDASIDLGLIEPGLSADLTAEHISTVLEPFAVHLRAAANHTLTLADLEPDRVGRVLYVGGSSLMAIVPNSMRELFPTAEHSFSEVFTAVADGLAIAADAVFDD
ncbi:MAG: Hsp70 family protein, partial [Pseudomonadota bacterium]